MAEVGEALSSKDLKGRKPIVYLRISTDEQAPGDKGKPPSKKAPLVKQRQRVEAWLKAQGLKAPKDADVFYEVGSAGDPTRPVWAEARAAAQKAGAKGFMVMTESSRWGREITSAGEMRPLRAANVPVVFAEDLAGGLILGTDTHPNGTGDVLFGIKLSLASGERENTRQKEKRTRTALKEQGIYTARPPSVWPFARVDMWDWLTDNVDLLLPKKQGGLGQEAFGRLMSSTAGPESQMYAPNAAGGTKAWKTMRDRLDTVAALRSEDPLRADAWVAWRRRLRLLEKDRGTDLATGVGKWDPEVAAVRYRFDGFLARPEEKDADGDYVYEQPTDERVAEIMADPANNLSFKALKKYKSVVSKRRK